MLETIKLFAASKELVAEEDEGFDSEPADLHLPVDLEVEGGDDSDEEDVRGAAEDEDGQDEEDVDITLPEGEEDLASLKGLRHANACAASMPNPTHSL